MTVSMLSAASVLAQAPVVPPIQTTARPVDETFHGTTIADPYRWLEGDNSNPERLGQMNDEVAAWTDAQNARTRAVLDSLPGRDKVEARLRELMTIGSVGAPNMVGPRYFYSKRDGNQNQAVLMVRESADGPGRVLLDPNTLDASGLVTLAWTSPSHDGKLLAFGLFRAGDENATLYVMDVDTGRWLAEEIPGKVSSVSWLPDSSGFFYERLRDVKDPYSAQIRFHRLGTHWRQDPILFRQYTKAENEKLATTWGPYFGISKDARWGILGYFTSTADNDLWVVDMDRWFRTGGPGLRPGATEDDPSTSAGQFITRPISVGNKGRSGGAIVGDTMFMQTTINAPNGRIVAVDLHNPDMANWREVVPERKDAVIEGMSLARGMIVVTFMKDVQSRIEMFDFAGKSLGEVPLPGIGTAGIVTEDDRTEAFLTFESYNEPNSIYRIDLTNPAQRSLWERPQVPVDPSIAEVKQLWFKSKDGTRVPMFVVHKKGLKLDGNNPTILNGYGGFNISEQPGFSRTLFPWLEAGGVFAVANIRGGGEFGDAWHRAGMLGSKQNTFDDFIAAAEHLIKEKYTSPERLGIVGGSNGGLLIGAVVTQRPDLFRAAICAVPLLDMLRYERFLMARYWVPEYGDPQNAEHFAWLRAYSPYQNIKPGTRYPSVLFTTGENDTRVHPMHARKMAAAMQAATASDQNDRPILLWVDRDSGHGAGKPLNLRIRDAADSRMYFMWQLGMLRDMKLIASDDAKAGQAADASLIAMEVTGMTCVMCAGKVEAAMKKVPGVASVKVDVESKRAEVRLSAPNAATPEQLAKALAGTDFSAKPL
ncbi:MAG: prolyl oligopeptidase family serine peptidase [Phycisphaerales bacterium]